MTSILSTDNPYVGALSCIDPILPEVEVGLRRQELKYPLGSLIRKSPFFGITIPSSTILPLQSLVVPTGSFVTLTNTTGILSSLTLYNNVFNTLNFTKFGTSIETNSTPTLTTTTSTVGNYTLYYLLYVQDPNSCIVGTNSFSVPTTTLYTDRLLTVPFQSLLSQSSVVLTNGTDQITIPLTAMNTVLSNSSSATLSGVPPGLLLVTILIPTTTPTLKTLTTYNVKLTLKTDLLSNDELAFDNAILTGII